MEDSRYRPPEADLPLVVPDSAERIPPVAPLGAEVHSAPQQRVVEQELAAEAIKKQPIVAFERAAKAAAVDKPFEQSIELSHEVRGDQAPTHIGQVVAGVQQRQPGLAQMAPPSPPPSAEPPLPQYVQPQQTHPYDVSSEPQPSMYRQAVARGFITAVLLLVLYVLISLLF